VATSATDWTRTRLPREQPVSASPRRIAATVVLTLLLVAGANFAFRTHLRQRADNLGYWMLDYKWSLLRDCDTPVDWLVLGDSSGNQGIDPRVLGAALGGRCLNLCTVGSFTALSDAVMLDAYVRRHGPPRGVVLVHVYDVWNRDLKLPLAARFDPGALAAAGLTPACVHGWRDRVRLWLYRYVPLDSSHKTIARILQGRETNASAGPFHFVNGYMPQWRPAPHAVHDDFDRHMAKIAAPAESAADTCAGTELSADNRAALERIVALADAYDFPVYLVPSPVYAGLWDVPAFRTHFARVHDEIAAVFAASPRTQVLFHAPATFAADEMQNADHVTARAAADFTATVGREIRAVEAGTSAPRADRSPSPAGGEDG
jgi:hypothetical protein